MPRRRPAIGLNSARRPARRAATAPDHRQQRRQPEPADALDAVARRSRRRSSSSRRRRRATKNACASDSWPVVPTSRVSPIAPMVARHREQAGLQPEARQRTAAAASGQHARSARPQRCGAARLRHGSSPGVPNSPAGRHSSTSEHDHVRDDVAEARGRGTRARPGSRRSASRRRRSTSPPTTRAGGRVEAAEHRRRERAEGRAGPTASLDAGGREAR